MGEQKHDEQEKLRAAYALNMCTVSVSQIVDYNDEYILEQEYEAILNNLNLEQMPKDEALLNILVKLLNVITFFRIDKVKKEQIEQKYQQRVRNAIWSAVPNIGIIVAGNPLSTAFSLATQVGISYLNYRREKANAKTEKADSEMELRITAMEQFNALRRELFTTAWRLADEYDFPDQYRLTERQIAQYNRILMDTDELRKYERLAAVQDKFEAYLPFWYFMGHTAKYISEDRTNRLEPAARKYFRNLAKSNFEKFDRLNTFNIMREDELTSSFSLEYTDLLLEEEHPDYKKIGHLIQTAVAMAGNAEDILELCAVSYLKIGKTESAEKILRILVNEDYNTPANAKLLSRIYVSEYLQGKNPLARTRYETLKTRVNTDWMFPMPHNIKEDSILQDKKLQRKYLQEQRFYLLKEYQNALKQFILKYSILFNRIIPMPEKDAPDEYFLNSEAARKRRRQDVNDALNGKHGDEYRMAIRESGFRSRYIELLNQMLEALDELQLFREDDEKERMIDLIQKNLAEAGGDLKTIQEHLDHSKDFTIVDYEKIQKSFSLQRLTEEFFDTLQKRLMNKIGDIRALNVLDKLELDLTEFCRSQGITGNDKNAEPYAGEQEDIENNSYISMSVLGIDERDERLSRKAQEQMLSAIRKSTASIMKDHRKTELLIHGEVGFDMYFKNRKLNSGALKYKALAVLDDHTHSDYDLVITVNGIVPVKHNKIGEMREFDRISYQKKSLGLGWPEEYANSAVDIAELYTLIEKLARIHERLR